LSGVLLRSGAAPAADALALSGVTLPVPPQIVDPLAELGAGGSEDVSQALAAVGAGLLAAPR
jgi:hypothetical protein